MPGIPAEDLLRSAFELAPFFIAVVHGPEHVFTTANPSYRRLIGGREVIGLRVRDALPEVVEQGFLALLDEVYRTGQPYTAETLPVRLRPAPGAPEEERYLSFAYLPLHDADGRVHGILAHGVDLTDQILALNALRESEFLVRQMAESIPDVFFLSDRRTGRMLYASPGFERLWGLSLQAVYDRPEPFLELIHPDDRAASRASFEKMFRGEAHVHEYRQMLPDGEIRWLSTRVFSVSGDADRMAGITSDITERHRMVEAQRESDARYRGLVAEVPVGLYRTTPDGRLLAANPALRSILGVPDPEVAPEVDIRGLYVDPEDRSRWAAELERTGMVVGMEVQLQRADDARRIWVRHSARAERDAQGRVLWYQGAVEDVTERRRAEERVRESEERFRMIVEGARDYAILTTDADGRIEGWSPGAEAVLGWSAAETLGQPVDITFTPEDRAQGRPEQERAAARERGVAVDARWHLRKDGSRVFIKGSSRPLHTASGRLRGYMKIGRDVTEERQMATALEESEEQLRQTLDTLPVGVFLTDAAGQIVWHNAASERIWDSVRHVGPERYDEYRGWWAESGERVRSEEWAAARALRGEDIPGEVIDIESFGGVRRTILNSAAPMRTASGKVTGVVWAQQDISELRALEAEHRTLGSALERLSEGIVLLSVEGEVQYANLAWRKMLGLEAGTTDIHLRDFVSDPETVREQESNLRTAAETGRWAGRVWRRRKSDGELMPLDMFIGRVEGAHRERSVLFGIVRDATEQIKQERQLRRAERLAGVGTLVAGVAHELNNPLQAILGFTELLILDARIPEHREDLEIIAREAGRMARIVSDLRQVARSTQDEGATKLPIDLNDAVRHVLQVQDYRLRTQNIEVEADLGTNLPEVLADRPQIEQVVLNLVVNAMQAMTAHAERGRLTLRTRPSARGVALYVSDDGPGIPLPHLEQIFDPFFTTKAPGEGTGLGLSLVHSIITEHGGEIRVDSGLGEGTTFRVDLPRTLEPAGPPNAGEAEPVPQPSLRVLVVDDEAAIRRLLVRFLERGGHSVDEADEGGAALALIERGEYDLILSDLRMPGVGGEALLERLRERGLSDRVVFLTGDQSDAVARLQVAGVPVLHKPIQLHEVARAVAEFVPGRGRPQTRT